MSWGGKSLSPATLRASVKGALLALIDLQAEPALEKPPVTAYCDFLPPKARCPKVKAEISYQGSTGNLCQRRVQGCFEAQMLFQAVHAVLPPLHTPSRSVLDRRFQFLISFM